MISDEQLEANIRQLEASVADDDAHMSEYLQDLRIWRREAARRWMDARKKEANTDGAQIADLELRLQAAHEDLKAEEEKYEKLRSGLDALLDLRVDDSVTDILVRVKSLQIENEELKAKISGIKWFP